MSSQKHLRAPAALAVPSATSAGPMGPPERPGDSVLQGCPFPRCLSVREESQRSLPVRWLCSLALPKASALSDGDASVALGTVRAPPQAAPACPAGYRAVFWPGCWGALSAWPHRAAGSIASRRATPTCCAAPIAAHMLSSAAITAPSRGCAALLRAALAPAQTKSHRFPPPQEGCSAPGRPSFSCWAGGRGWKGISLGGNPCFPPRLPAPAEMLASPHPCVGVFFWSVNSDEANLAEDVK